MLVLGCTPAFDDAECYGPGECARGEVCLGRRCEPAREGDAGAPEDRPRDRALTTFAHDPLPLTLTRLRAVVPRPDGGVLFAGAADDGDGETLLVAATGPEGALDPAFADGGVLRWRPEGVRASAAHALALRPDGRLVVAGWALRDTAPSMVVLQVHPDGEPDATFATDGVAEVSDLAVGAGGQVAEAIALTSGGRVVVAGVAATIAPDVATRSLVALRLRADGTPDAAFGDAGRFVYESPGGDALEPVGLALTSVGASLVLARCESGVIPQACVARITSDGRLDAVYGVTGVARVRLPSSRYTHAYPRSLALDAAGGLLVAGATGGREHAYVARIGPDGDLDPAFAGGVLVEEEATASVGAGAHCEGVVALHASSARLSVRRYRADGALDDGFAAGGVEHLSLRPGGVATLAHRVDGEWIVAAHDQRAVRLAGVRVTCYGSSATSLTARRPGRGAPSASSAAPPTTRNAGPSGAGR